MTVKELIAVLAKLPEDAKVNVWDAYRDEATSTVEVSHLRDGTVLLCNVKFSLGVSAP